MNPPTKPTDTRYRVNPGGGWDSDVPLWVRAASRNADVPAHPFDNIGFRCALRGRQPRT